MLVMYFTVAIMWGTDLSGGLRKEVPPSYDKCHLHISLSHCGLQSGHL